MGNTFFSDFENSNLMTSWRPLLLFSVGALSRSQFCSDFLKILGHVSKTQSPVCYYRLGHSHGRNFAQIFLKFWDMLVKLNPLFAIIGWGTLTVAILLRFS